MSPYEPTAEEIRAECELIQAGWTPADFWSRSDGRDQGAYLEMKATGAGHAKGTSWGKRKQPLERPPDVIPVVRSA